MKTFLHVLLFTFSSTQAFSQITLEHDYPVANIRRLNVEGEILYACSYTINGVTHLKYFDQTHQPLSAVTLNFTPSNAFANFISASRTFFDDDPGIETTLSISGSGSRFVVVDDNGAILLDKPTGNTLFQHEVNGQKRIYYGYEIISLPNFQTLYTFSNLGSTNIFYLNMAADGPRYAVMNLNGDLELYDATNFNLIQTLSGNNSFSPNCVPSVLLWDRNMINDNPEIEWSFVLNCNGNFNARYYSGSDILIDFAGPGVYFSNQFLPSRYPSLQSPKVLYRSISSTDTFPSFVYDINTGQPEAELAGRWVFGTSDVTDLVYFPSALNDAFPLPYPVLDGQYNTWELFTALLDGPRALIAVSESTFDNDPNTKEALIRHQKTDNQYVYFIQRPSGTSFFQLDSFPSATVSRLPGFSNKLIFTRASSLDSTLNRTLVYSLPSTTLPTGEPFGKTLSFSAWPNPFLQELKVDLSAISGKVLTLTLTDVLGKVHFTTDQIPISETFTLSGMRHLPGGLYFLSLRTDSGSGTIPVVKK